MEHFPLGMSMATSWQHQKFAREWFEHGDLRRAARAAGSKAVSDKALYAIGHKWLHDHRTQSEIERLKGIADDKTIQSAAEVKSEVNSIINESIKLARDGDPIITKQGGVAMDSKGRLITRVNVPAMLKGAELKGKTVGMFTDVQRIEGEMEGKSDEELFHLVAAALTNPMILELVAQHEDVVRKVHEFDRRDARAREGRAGDAAPEAESVPAASEAGGVSSSRVH